MTKNEMLILSNCYDIVGNGSTRINELGIAVMSLVAKKDMEIIELQSKIVELNKIIEELTYEQT